MGKIVAHLQHGNGGLEVVHFDGEGRKGEDFLLELESPSLFSKGRVVVCDGYEQVSPKKAPLDLKPFLSGGPQEMILVVGTSDFGSINGAYQYLKKSAVVLDLLGEKPWDHRDRIIQTVIGRVMESNKTIDPKVVNLLVDQHGLDLAGLEQEVDKWITYLGDEDEITMEHLRLLGSHILKESSNYQIAETLVWEGKSLNLKKDFQMGEMLALLGSVRFHLTLALKICYKLQNQEPVQEGAHFGRMKQKKLNQYATVCQKMGEAHFRNAIVALFELELDAKNDRINTPLFHTQLIRILKHEPIERYTLSLA